MKKMPANRIYSIVTGSIETEHKHKEPDIQIDFYTEALEANNFS